MFRSFLLALMFLTNLPVNPGGNVTMAEIMRAAPAYPLIGGLVGLFGGAAYFASIWLGIPALVAVILAVSVCIVITGALHEDGLADVADSFGAFGSREKRLSIMRDSRIGTFGVLALIVATALKIALYDALAMASNLILVMIASHALSRALMLLPVIMLSPARADGLAKDSGQPPKSSVFLAFFVGVLMTSMAIVPDHGVSALIAMLLPACVAYGFAVWQNRALGGYTGDTLGATQQITEIAFLLALVILVH